MSSPVGHSLIGYIIYQAAAKPIGLPKWQLIALCLLAANAPDLDFIPGLLIGDPNRYHRGISHSIGLAMLFALGFSLIRPLLKKAAVGRDFAIFFSLYGSHIGLDYLTIDHRFPYGVPLFWPLSNEYYIAPFAFLPSIQRSSFANEFISSLFSPHNRWAVSIEFLWLFPFLLLILALTRESKTISEYRGPP